MDISSRPTRIAVAAIGALTMTLPLAGTASRADASGGPPVDPPVPITRSAAPETDRGDGLGEADDWGVDLAGRAAFALMLGAGCVVGLRPREPLT
jgi:hypothetical protein